MSKKLKMGIALGITVVVILAVVVVGVGVGTGLGAPGIPHQLQGRTGCATCHGQGSADPYPGWHADRKFDNGRCLSCHHVKAS